MDGPARILPRLVGAALQYACATLLLQCNIDEIRMSKQLSVASAFSVFALSALALLAPGSAHPSDAADATGATIGIAAPAFLAELPFVD